MFSSPHALTNTSFSSFDANLGETLAITEDITFQSTLIDQLLTIDINNCCVGTMDFSVKPGTDKYEELVPAGWSGMNEYLEGYKSLKDGVPGLREKFRAYFGR